jgi:CubicO group peptidase (beta-lactamase class C family)
VLAAPALAGSDPFPKAEPASVGLKPETLRQLADVVRGWVSEGKIVGGELHVIKNRRTVLHEGFGHRDREAGAAMEPGTIFCVRSMTKPVVGLAAQLLIEDGKLALDDPVAKHFPSFDNEKSRAITLDHLLTHTSGLPLSSLLNLDHRKVKSVREIADRTGARGPDFKPGTRWQYSDDGADTATALVAELSGQPIEQFLRERLFEPIGMEDAICVFAKDDPRRKRAAVKYGGVAGQWTPFWTPAAEPLFPVFLGSQALYTTTTDYARLLACLMDGGLVGERRVLSEETVRRAREPLQTPTFPHGFQTLRTRYGRFLSVYTDAAGKAAAFGHAGSDGTHAWAWPGQDLIVLFFTQSRGNLTGIDLEVVLERFVEGRDRVASREVSAASVEPYQGLFKREGASSLVSVRFDGKRLAVEVPADGAMVLQPTDDQDRWVLEVRRDRSVRFERDAKGKVTGFTLQQQTPARFQRFEAEADLPTPEALAELRARTHRLDTLTKLGAMRARGTVKASREILSGTLTWLAQGLDRSRTEAVLGGKTQLEVVDGPRVWRREIGAAALEEVTGILAEQSRHDHPLFPLADFGGLFQRVRLLQRANVAQKPCWVLWCESAHARPRVLYLEIETGRLLQDEHLEEVPGMGLVGKRVLYEDWREVEGIPFPFRAVHRYRSQLLGTFTQDLEAIETGAPVPDGAFSGK